MDIAHMLHYTARLTFGRETAQFKQLIAFMAMVSIIIWSIVIATMIVRLVARHVLYRKRYSASRSNFPSS